MDRPLRRRVRPTVRAASPATRSSLRINTPEPFGARALHCRTIVHCRTASGLPLAVVAATTAHDDLMPLMSYPLLAGTDAASRSGSSGLATWKVDPGARLGGRRPGVRLPEASQASFQRPERTGAENEPWESNERAAVREKTTC